MAATQAQAWPLLRSCVQAQHFWSDFQVGLQGRTDVTCIFCSAEATHRSVAHIVPESLGGKTSPIGRPGVTCDACNQYFGQKVESKALRSFPFIGFRVLTGVPSKKGTMPSMMASVGNIHATGQLGSFELNPRTEKLSRLVETGEVTQLRIIAEVTEPLAVCRMLLKIGLEQLGKHFYEVAISERVRAARTFARRPVRGTNWWFMLRSRPDEYVRGKSQFSETSIEIIEQSGILFSVMHMTGISTMIPLEHEVLPPPKGDFPEPEYRMVFATC